MVNNKENNILQFDILVHPGETLKDVLEGENMTQSELALRTEISEKHISNIIKGKAGITPDTALKLQKVFGISAEFWNNLQKTYEQDKARLEEKELMTKKIEEEKEILKEIKSGYKNLAEFGFVEKISFVGQKNKEIILNNLYSFFKVSSLKNIKEIFNIPKMNISYKKTNSLKLNEYNLACWLRAGEIKIENMELGEYSKSKLKEVLVELKSMTKKEIVDIKKIQELLEGAGIYFSFVSGFDNVPVFGITRKYKGKPFVQVSDRGKKADGFWFALFHELAHVQLHLHKKDDILINIDDKEEEKEIEANKWARDYLINEKEYEQFCAGNITVNSLIDFADNQGVGTHIVAGRLGFDHDAYREVSKFRTILQITNY